MKKLFLFCYLSAFTFSQLLFSQTILPPELPEVIPPTPTAYEITKYGNVPINESSGRISKNIPLYNYKAGNLEIPISMSYIGNGVKVDQLPTWTGINWSLSAGGVITRVVKDRPDESIYTTRILYDWEDLTNLDLQNNQANINQMHNIANGGSYDTEIDVFNFSFGDYSGSFYLGEKDISGNYECIQTKHDSELKINFSITTPDVQQEFQITTPDGVIYYFGSSIATEQTRTDHYASGIVPTTSYYLYKIVHPFGDAIFLTYENIADNYTLRMSQYHWFTKVLHNIPANSSFCDYYGGQSATDYGQIFNQIYNGKYLSEISSNRSSKKVVFKKTSVSNNMNYNRVLNSIEIEDNLHPTTDENIVFSYIYPGTINNSSRFFLEKIEFKNNLDNLKYDYDFEYNDPLSLPGRMSFSQDYLGYNNGASSNTTLLPKGQSDYYFPDSSPGPVLADRNPNFNAAIKGSLKKINYPTGGFTEIEYEAPQKMVQERHFLKVFCSQSNLIPDTELTDVITLAKLDPVNGIISGIFEDQTISVNVNVNASGNINHHYVIRVKVTNESSTPNEIQEQSMFLETGIYDYNRSFDFDLLKDNIYKVEMVLEPDPNSQSMPSPVYVTGYLDALTGTTTDDWLGIRVKKTLDYTDSTATPITKRYYYKKIQNYINPIEDPYIIFQPNFITFSTLVVCCPASGGGGQAPDPIFSYTDTYVKATLNSSTSNHYSPSTDGQNYKNVSISYGGDHFENGGIEKQFSFRGNPQARIYSDGSTQGDGAYISNFLENARDNKGIYDGYLTNQSTFKKHESELFLTNKDDLNYFISTKNSNPNIIVKKVYEECNFDPNNLSINKLLIASYNTFSLQKNLLSKKTTSYIDPVPISNLDNASNYKQITKTQDYEYDSYAGLTTKITTSTSNSDKVLETRNYYVDQIGQLSGLTGTQITDYTSLINGNRLTNVIQSENYQIDGTNTSELLSTQRTLFKNWNSASLILPEYVQTSILNNSLENRIRFYDYSIYGDLLEVSKENGSKIRYVYTNTSQVSRKIENYDSSTNQPAFSSNSVRTPCYYQNEHPNSFVTLFNYKNGTNLIETIEDSRCRKIYYHYDEFNRLKFVKDHDGKILSENEYNYKN